LRTFLRYFAVWLVGCLATSSGIPSAIISPPLSPPSGPKSIIQSEHLITSKLCSITITEFPLSDFPKERTITEEKIRKYTYTKEEVKILLEAAVKEAVDEARRIDDESMAKHNREATVISMILGFTTLALFVDGLLRMLGIIPPFMHLDVNILDKIETDIIDRIKQVPIQKILQQGFR